MSTVPVLTHPVVRLVTAPDSAQGVLDVAGSILRRPLAVVRSDGEVIAAAPHHLRHRLAIAPPRAAEPVVPGGWLVRRVRDDVSRCTWLLIGPAEDARLHDDGPPADLIFEALCAVLRERLQRASLRHTLIAERRSAVQQRAITDPAVRGDALRREARAAQFEFAPCYWPAVLLSHRGQISARVLADIGRAWARRASPGSFVAGSGGLAIVLYGLDKPGCAGAGRVQRAIETLVESLVPVRAVELRAILAEQAVPLDRLPSHVALLRRMQQLHDPPARRGTVLHVRDFSVDMLLQAVDAPIASEYVRGHLGSLLGPTDEHADLVDTLEFALDYPRRGEAAHAAHVHRNTFRRQLQRALEAVDVDLDDPEQCLALRVALKLHRLSC